MSGGYDSSCHSHPSGDSFEAFRRGRGPAPLALSRVKVEPVSGAQPDDPGVMRRRLLVVDGAAARLAPPLVEPHRLTLLRALSEQHQGEPFGPLKREQRRAVPSRAPALLSPTKSRLAHSEPLRRRLFFGHGAGVSTSGARRRR